jgi:hypothetical protein
MESRRSENNTEYASVVYLLRHIAEFERNVMGHGDWPLCLISIGMGVAWT